MSNPTNKDDNNIPPQGDNVFNGTEDEDFNAALKRIQENQKNPSRKKNSMDEIKRELVKSLVDVYPDEHFRNVFVEGISYMFSGGPNKELFENANIEDIKILFKKVAMMPSEMLKMISDKSGIFAGGFPAQIKMVEGTINPDGSETIKQTKSYDFPQGIFGGLHDITEGLKPFEIKGKEKEKEMPPLWDCCNPTNNKDIPSNSIPSGLFNSIEKLMPVLSPLLGELGKRILGGNPILPGCVQLKGDIGNTGGKFSLDITNRETITLAQHILSIKEKELVTMQQNSKLMRDMGIIPAVAAKTKKKKRNDSKPKPAA